MRVSLNIVKSDANKVAATRECGPCTACCVLPRISPTEDKHFSEGKPGYHPCHHLDMEGCKCSIYHKRPGLCRDYTCLWRAGIIRGDNSRRPDQLGLMFTVDEVQGKLCIEAWELWEGASSDHTARYVIETIAEQYSVSIRPYGVPVSNLYFESRHFQMAKQLSELSRIAPRTLAVWIEARMKDGTLEMPNDSSAYQDLELLRQGIPVKRYYKRPE